MLKKLNLLLFSALFLFSFHSVWSQSLKINNNKPYLIKADGTPIFWLEGTAK